MARQQTIREDQKLHEVLALAGFVFFFAFQFVKSTMMIAWATPNYNRIVTYLNYLIVILSIILSDRYSWKELLLLAGAGVVAVLITGISDSNVYLVFLLYMIAFQDIDKKKIAKAALVTGLLVTVAAVILSRLGVIENLVYTQTDGAEIRVRQSFGFIYPTDFAAHVFYLLLLVFYLSDGKLNLFTAALYLFFAWFVKSKCDARLSMVMILLVFGASLVLTLWKQFRIRGLLKWGMILAFPIGSILTFLLEWMYGRGMGVAVKLNNILSDRLVLGLRLLKEHGVPLLGKAIEQHGNGGTLDSVVQYFGEYSYIDMSFQRILQMYGLIAFVVLMVFVMFATKKQIDRGNVIVPVILTVVTINSIIDQHYLDFAYNIFLFMLLDHNRMRKITVKQLKNRLRRKRRGKLSLQSP